MTTSPDVTVSTNLGSWVNRRGVFSREPHGSELTTSPMSSPQKWTVSAEGQHIELGIAENNLFLMLAAFGLSAPLFGARLLPIGTVYDPFINRGLDALNYACYQDARFILVATPSGLSLAPEGGAHQSVYTPLIGMGQPSMTAFEPAYVDELCEIMRWSFEHIQSPQGGSVYLRLSTRPLEQRQRPMTPELARDVVEGAYWLKPPASGSDLAIVASGAVVQEALAAYELLAEDVPEMGLLVVTSAARLHRGWLDGSFMHRSRLLLRVPHQAIGAPEPSRSGQRAKRQKKAAPAPSAAALTGGLRSTPRASEAPLRHPDCQSSRFGAPGTPRRRRMQATAEHASRAAKRDRAAQRRRRSRASWR